MTRFMSPETVNTEELNKIRKDANRALKVLNDHLDKNSFIAIDYSMADIACYGQLYTAEEGKINLSEYSNIKAWQKRVESQPCYIEMRTKATV